MNRFVYTNKLISSSVVASFDWNFSCCFFLRPKNPNHFSFRKNYYYYFLLWLLLFNVITQAHFMQSRNCNFLIQFRTKKKTVKINLYFISKLKLQPVNFCINSIHKFGQVLFQFAFLTYIL